jgi:hypothetical protein
MAVFPSMKLGVRQCQPSLRVSVPPGPEVASCTNAAQLVAGDRAGLLGRMCSCRAQMPTCPPASGTRVGAADSAADAILDAAVATGCPGRHQSVECNMTLAHTDVQANTLFLRVGQVAVAQALLKPVLVLAVRNST